MNVRKGDTVLVLAGKDRGKRGVVERIERTKRGLGVVVPGINMAKRHQRPKSRTQQAGILDLPVPLHLSNVQVVCPRCDRPTRDLAPAARGNLAARSRLPALRRADGGGQVTDEKPKRTAAAQAASRRPARSAPPGGRGSRRARTQAQPAGRGRWAPAPLPRRGGAGHAP